MVARLIQFACLARFGATFWFCASQVFSSAYLQIASRIARRFAAMDIQERCGFHGQSCNFSHSGKSCKAYDACFARLAVPKNQTRER